MSPLEKCRPEAGAPWLVYTSAGDRSNVARWLDKNRSFDLWVTYYGDAPASRLGVLADYYNVRRGAKYQNLHHAYGEWPDIWTRYSAVLVMDDDIVIDGRAIGELFRTRETHGYWIVQPGFSPRGKIAHPITRARRSRLRRETNFVENGCALFQRDVLDRFMTIYDPALAGWGTDWLYLHMLGSEIKGRVAIIDAVRCINPRDRSKGGREIERLQSREVRRATWQHLKATRGLTIDEKTFTEFSAVRTPSPLHPLLAVADVVEDWYLYGVVPRARKFVRKLRRKFGRRAASH